jgi:hypothetical protein
VQVPEREEVAELALRHPGCEKAPWAAAELKLELEAPIPALVH